MCVWLLLLGHGNVLFSSRGCVVQLAQFLDDTKHTALQNGRSIIIYLSAGSGALGAEVRNLDRPPWYEGPLLGPARLSSATGKEYPLTGPSKSSAGKSDRWKRVRSSFRLRISVPDRSTTVRGRGVGRVKGLGKDWAGKLAHSGRANGECC